jgi:hypothetical protein
MNSMVALVMMTTVGFAPTAVSSTAQVFDQDSRLLAEARFDAGEDTFALTKSSAVGGRAYLEYRYVRTDGTPQTGTHRGGRQAGDAVRFDHDFGEGRKITFRVCVEGEYAFNACSGTDNGENWTAAIT